MWNTQGRFKGRDLDKRLFLGLLIFFILTFITYLLIDYTSQGSFYKNGDKLIENTRLAKGKIYYFLFPKNIHRDLYKTPITELVRNDNALLKYWLKIAGIKQVMNYLKEYSIRDKHLNCHIYAHSVGRESYYLYRGLAFSINDQNCGSGYIHGVMEALLQHEGPGDLSQKINNLCLSLDKLSLQGQCVHGIGHGLLVYEEYDLPAALDRCKEINQKLFHHFCYTGVFMENIISSEGFSLHPSKTIWVSNDPYFPCNKISLESEIQKACYLYQASRMLDLTSDNFNQVWDLCLDLDNNQSYHCVHNIGQEAAYRTGMDASKTLDICRTHLDFIEPCLKGALTLIAHYWEDLVKDQPHKLCRELSDNKHKQYCYQEIGKLLLQIFDEDQEKIDSICRFSEENYQEICRESSRKFLLRS